MYKSLQLHIFAAGIITHTLAQSSASLDVVWQSPASGDVFGPGDTIIGKWQAAQSVVSPSFRLCAGGSGSDGCGATIWADVKESAGSYLVSLAVPNVTTESGYTLQMKDDFGKSTTSPVFNLSPTPQDAAPDAGAQSDPASPAPASSPGNPNPPPNTPPDNAAPNPSAPSGASQAAPSATRNPTNPASNVSPLVASAHSAPPVAALAVPLSLAGAIVLAAAILGLHHRRKLAKEREIEAEILKGVDTAPTFDDLSRRASLLSQFKGNNNVDLEKALVIQALLSGSRTSTVLPATSVYAHPRPAAPPTQRTPEPRPRTRQPFSACYNQPPTPQPSLRPLTRHREFPTPAHPPPDVLDPLEKAYAQTLQAIDSEDSSATSGLVSSYLPSPAFDAVPLSPPPALHVRHPVPSASPFERDKAHPLAPTVPDPTIQNGSEQPGRGVYDAVARALGGLRGF
ncbi:hypothetical protein BV25DRAFT_1915567 [Artomyces pyxidatus]|uniref:Uncharacterized protein n=1 Tax=Artomyces pyxidatus TaxID=48021 RepID=A0ACB8T4T1_9AGAM|nr:hypothetical protein BV25DRAFT_1915567 [Artomyces pyxidatus]